MKRILFTISNSEISGAEKQLLLLLKNINKASFHVEVCCLDGQGPFTTAVSSLGIKFFSFKRKSSFDVYRLFSLYKLIKQNDYDLLVSFCWSANQYSRIASFFTNKKHIACERGHDYKKNSLENKILKLLDPISMKIVFNSRVQMESYRKYIKDKPERLLCIYNSVNIYQVNQLAIEHFYKKFSIDNNKKIIGTVGNFSEHKNFDMFIEVCENIHKKYKNISFIAIGDGPQRKKYENIIRYKKLEKVIITTGYINDIYEIISLFDIFLLTSDWEGMPNVIMEAMAGKVPVVSTSIDGCKELIDDKKNGFLVKKNDIEHMCSNVQILIEQEDVYNEVVSNAFEKISKNYTTGNMIKDYEALFV